MKALLLLPLFVSLASATPVTVSLIEYHTKGPDTYADGTPVQVGESYYLVYAAPGFAFAGLNADGTLADPAHNEICSAAKAVDIGGGHVKCPLSVYQFPFGTHVGGTWYTVLADTRYQENVGGLVANVAVVAQGRAAFTTMTGTTEGATAEKAGSVLAGKVPAISSFKVERGLAVLEVTDLGVGTYWVEARKDLSSAWEDTGKGFQNADANVEAMTVYVPLDDSGAMFYRVVAE